MNSYYVKKDWPQVTEIMQAHLEFCTLDPVRSERDFIFLHNYSEKTWHNKKFVSRISWVSAMWLKNSMYLSLLANTEFKQEHPQWFLEHTSIFYSKNHKGKPSALQTIHVLVYFIWLTVNPAFQSWIISVWWHQIKGSDSCSHANKWAKQNVRDRNELCSFRTLPLFFWTFWEGKFESMEEQQHRTNFKYILWRACRSHTSVEQWSAQCTLQAH